MKKTILLVSLSLLLGACATTPGTPAASAENAASAIAAAEAARGKAAEVGYEWRDTAALIDEARKATEAKEYDKAIKLAGQAERQGVAALKQYEEQKNAADMH